MSMDDPVAIGVETIKIDSGCSLQKDFTELIRMNPSTVLYQIINQVDSLRIDNRVETLKTSCE